MYSWISIYFPSYPTTISFEALMRILPFGSCRIFEPLWVLKGLRATKVLEERARYYTHCANEVLQKNDLLNLRRTIAPELFPLIVGEHKKIELFHHDLQKKHLNKKKNDYFSKTDAVVIEISSLKEIVYKNIYAQMGAYKLIRNSENLQNKKITNFLKKAEHRTQTSDELFETLNRIIRHFRDKEIILLPHLNTVGNNGEKIQSREIIASVLESCAKANKTHFIDPTALVEEHQAYSPLLNSTHYNPHFYPVIAKAIYQKLVSKKHDIIDNLIKSFIFIGQKNHKKNAEILNDIRHEILDPKLKRRVNFALAMSLEEMKKFQQANMIYREELNIL